MLKTFCLNSCLQILLRDGYTVDKVGGLASSCDSAIKREGNPTVGIESKAIGKDTNEKVHKEKWIIYSEI